MRQLFASLLLVLPLAAGCGQKVTAPAVINELPVIYPDYVGVTVPATIAPLNFTMKEGAFELLDVIVRGARSGEIHVQSDEAISIPQAAWKDLLARNSGDKLMLTLSVKSDGAWKQYQDFPINVSSYPIDYGLAYRLVAPSYRFYGLVRLYDRDLSTFNERAILETTQKRGLCVNCHSFNRCNPQDLSLHLRGSSKVTIVRHAGSNTPLSTKTESTIAQFSYPCWHPQGRYIAYSLNNTSQLNHVAENERVEYYDRSADLIVYDREMNEVLKSDLLTSDRLLETSPAFSPDGKTLYFCAAEAKNTPLQWKDVRYNLCSIAFDASTGSFGNKVETLLDAAAMKKSIAFPRPSFDGNYILFSLMEYGNFAIWHRDADLWLLNLKDKTYRPLTSVNSDAADGFHSWSSNSHWFVFSSRRDDGQYTRLYIASLNDRGEAGKPFMLPQRNPFVYYDELLYSYNVPEFLTQRVPLDAREIDGYLTTTEPLQVKVREVK